MKAVLCMAVPLSLSFTSSSVSALECHCRRISRCCETRAPFQIPRCTLPVQTFETPIPSSPYVVTLLNHLATKVPDRGIFGLQDPERDTVESLMQEVESNPVPQVGVLTDDLSGIWRVVYTTVEVLGRRRVRLGIGARGRAGLVTMGTMWQLVDWKSRSSRNVVEFDIAKTIHGAFQVTADFEVADLDAIDVGYGTSGKSRNRVNVAMRDWSLRPKRLVELLGGEAGILLDIFNPEGWLDVTYVDERCRIGRDNKGNVFVLERHMGQTPKVFEEYPE